jgi:hypothetical protein
MVSFRLSEQEYESLLNLCSSRGARSLSDLARHTMQTLLGDCHGDGLTNLVQQLQKRMNELDLEVKKLTQLAAEQKCASTISSP